MAKIFSGRQPVRRATCLLSYTSGGGKDSTFPLPKTEKPKIKIPKKSVEKVLRKRRFSDVMLSHFGSKNGKCLKIAGMFSFEARTNRKILNGVKLNALQNGYLVFYFFYFNPKIHNFVFNNNCMKIQNCQVIKKTG